MNVRFSADMIDGRPPIEAAGRDRERCLFLLTPTQEECGVESFARLMVSELQKNYPDAGYAMLAVSGRWRDLPALFRKIVKADQIVFSVPLVAWKRKLVLPLASRTIITVSPYIAGEIANTRWLLSASAKCRLAPNAPVVRRPPEPNVTERVRRVREATKRCDIVIGYFGAIYKGKAATALLDVCDELRRRGVRATVLYVGGFLNSIDRYEQQFWAHVGAFGIGDRVTVTGYVADEAELYTLFEEVGCFLFLFPEGLTSRRSSVIHTMQSDRPVV